jgi:ABC-type transport system substrate-binding protein
VGGNWSRYRSADLDSLIDRYQTTIPKGERMEVLSQILNHIAENVTTVGLYYNPVPYAVANRVANVPVNRGSNSSIAWSIYEWDVRS